MIGFRIVTADRGRAPPRGDEVAARAVEALARRRAEADRAAETADAPRVPPHVVFIR